MAIGQSTNHLGQVNCSAECHPSSHVELFVQSLSKFFHKILLYEAPNEKTRDKQGHLEKYWAYLTVHIHLQ